jgi:hypothetical protein
MKITLLILVSVVLTGCGTSFPCDEILGDRELSKIAITDYLEQQVEDECDIDGGGFPRNDAPLRQQLCFKKVYDRIELNAKKCMMGV